MSKKEQRRFTESEKRNAVDEFISGKKTAIQLAAELGVTSSLIYKWKVYFEEKAKGSRLDELASQGIDIQTAKRLLQMELELDEYKKKVGQQAVIIDLLKKLQNSVNYQSESEVTGLIDTIKLSARKKKLVKR
jgi:transposase-like protein